MLSREEHQLILASMLENPETANISELGTQLTENYGAVLADLIINTERVEALKKQNEELTAQNMKLFLKIGQTEPENETIDLNEEVEEELKFEDLADEKGYIFK